MQKARRALAQIAGRFLFIGISVQIVLGICWMIGAFGIFPEFGDSYLWLRAADTLVCDDYMGIGYPLFLMLAKGIESISSIPYPFFVYTVQAGVGKSRTSDLPVCPAVSCGGAAELSGIFFPTAGIVGAYGEPASGCGWRSSKIPSPTDVYGRSLVGAWHSVCRGEPMAWTGAACGGMGSASDPRQTAGKTESAGRTGAAGSSRGDFIHGGISVADARQLW